MPENSDSFCSVFVIVFISVEQIACLKIDDIELLVIVRLLRPATTIYRIELKFECALFEVN